MDLADVSAVATHANEDVSLSSAMDTMISPAPLLASSGSSGPINVLVFTSLYPNHVSPHLGVFIKERMTRYAKSSGNSVRVVAPVPYFPPFKWSRRYPFSQISHAEMIDGIEVCHPRYMMTPKVGMMWYGLLMFLSVLPRVSRIYREFKFDVIDAHFVYPDGFAAMLLGRWFKKPVVVSARGSDINQYKDFPVIRKLLLRTLHGVDRVIAVSQALKDTMVRLGVSSEHISVVPNGVDPGKFAPISRQEAREALKLSSRKLILSVGNLTQNKGMDLLVKALHTLVHQRHHTDLRLAIVGDGPCRRPLAELVRSLNLLDYVLLVGAVPHHELNRWYSAADVFCLASAREGLPNVVLEALACGTPVVATPVGGIPEVISSERVGLLARRDEHHLADTIAMALERSWDRTTLVQHVNGWTWDHVATALQGVFESVLSRSNAGGCRVTSEARCNAGVGKVNDEWTRIS